MSYASYFILCLFFSYACSHLCIISPKQRGPIDIRKGGSHTCFRHGAPCGGQPEEAPKVTYPGGQPVFIKWQQNYNHYEPGYPGYMDVAVARSDDLENFQLLAFVQDEYVYRQDYQRNYTAVVVLPNLDCSHCVIRARYNAHKPGETIFYQCSDISITRTTSPESASSSMQSPPNEPEYRNIRNALILQRTNPVTSHQMSLPSVGQSFKIFGVAYDPYHNNASYYAQIDPTTGYIGALNFYDAGLGSGDHMITNSASRVHIKGSAILEERRFLLDAVFAVDDTLGTTTYLFHSGSLDNLVSQMWIINTDNGRRNSTVELAISMPINSLHSDGGGNYIAFQIVNSEKPGFFEFRIDRIDSSGNVMNILETSSPEKTFINFQWAHYDAQDKVLYVLLGDENGADKLDARFYIFELTVGRVSNVDIDVSKYTFQSFQYYAATNCFLALSPGLFTSNNVTWTLVKVFPHTGVVLKVFDVGEPGIFQNYYGGTVYNGIDQQSGILTHVFRIAESGADIIAYININNGRVTYSQLNNIRSIHNLALHYV